MDSWINKKCGSGGHLRMAILFSIFYDQCKYAKQQLTGVDMMYLHMLVDTIRLWREENDQNVDLDSNYVVEIIDRIFGI